MTPRGGRGWLVAVMVTTAGLGMGVLARAGAPEPPANPAAAWIDVPLDGMQVVPGSVDVLAHATDAGGVEAIVLLVDGDAVGEVGGLSGTLAQATFSVELEALGEHTLVARSRGAGGDADSSPVRLTVIDPATLTETTPPPTEVATTTATTVPGASTAPPATTAPPRTTTPPATTAPPTAPPTTTCTLVQPQALFPAGGIVVDNQTVTFEWDYSGPCDPASFVVQVSQDRTFSSVAVTKVVSGSSRYVTATIPCLNGTWQWRVAPSASPSGSSPGPWSNVGVFQLAATCRG